MFFNNGHKKRSEVKLLMKLETGLEQALVIS
jgi:hypothetical protein